MFKMSSEVFQKKLMPLRDQPISTILLAPKLCSDLVQQSKHRQKIDSIREYIKLHEGKLPETSLEDGIILSVIIRGTNTFIQAHDGNHRLMALALERPDATVADIIPYVRYVHDEHVSEPLPFFFHCFTNPIASSRKQFHTLHSAKDGDVKEVRSSSPIFFRDPTIFQHGEVFDGCIYTSFGLSLKTLVDSYESKTINLAEVDIPFDLGQRL